MSTAEKVVIAFILGVLAACLVVLALTVRGAMLGGVSPAAHRVHRDALASHDRQLRALWARQDRITAQLLHERVATARDGGMR